MAISRIFLHKDKSVLQALVRQREFRGDILRLIELTVDWQPEDGTIDLSFWRNMIHSAMGVDTWVIWKAMIYFAQYRIQSGDLQLLDSEEIRLLLDVYHSVRTLYHFPICVDFDG